MKKDVVKKAAYDKLVEKVSNIDTSGFVLKTKYGADKSELENKIPDTSGLVKKTDYNTKVTDIENKTPSISGLATNSALTSIEDKIPCISSLVRKVDYNTKLTEIEKKLTDHNYGKYITTPEINKLNAENLARRLKQAPLVTKTDFNDKLKSLNRRIISNKTKNLLVKNLKS